MALPLTAVTQPTGPLRGTPFAELTVDTVGRRIDIGIIMGTAMCADGSVLVADRTIARVLRVNVRDSIVATYGRPGAGPGELGFPYRVAERSDGRVIVYDLSNLSFSEFEANGRFLRRWVSSVPIVSIDDIVPLPGMALAVSGIVRDASVGQRAVHILDSTFRWQRSFGELPPSKSRSKADLWGAGSLSRTATGQLLFSRRIPYELSWFEANGRPVRSMRLAGVVSKSADEAFFQRSVGGQVTTQINTRFSYPLVAHQLPDGRVLASRKVNGVVYWDLISDAGRPLWSGRPPEGTQIVVGVDGTRSGFWIMGELESGEPALFFVRFADTHRKGE